MKVIILSIIFTLFPINIYALEGEENNQEEAVNKEKSIEQSKKESLFEPTQFGFGVGIGIARLNNKNIKSTVIENGIVRVTDEEDVSKSIWLETHYLFDKHKFGRYTSHGIFIGVQLGSEDNLFDAFSFGYMISFKRTPIGDNANKSAFNIGIGWSNTKINILGDGIIENAALPTGAESVRTKTIDTNGPILMFSFSVF